jgi:hypothetical protein|tara:strand:- start:365 stop:709 length:345 start_codon:yes stop_codon:yes gene_type:complete
MSNNLSEISTYTIVQDQIQMLLEVAASNPDLILRLKDVRRLKKELFDAVRELERKSAYEARMVFSIKDVAEVLDMQRADLAYIVSAYTDKYPELPKPRQRQRVDISKYLDLSRV